MKKFITVCLIILIFGGITAGILSATGAGFGQESNDTPVSDVGGLINKDGLPDIDISSWEYKLVDFENTIPPDFSVNTAVNSDGYLFDARAVNALDELLKSGRSEGMQLVLTSAYRSHSYQQMLFDDKVSRVMSEGNYSRGQAETLAAMQVAVPGTSEHQLGLAVDIVCEYYNILDEGYAETAEALWLLDNCAEYGFILSYPEDKQELTNVIFEPWHFRYVGVEAATYIMDKGLCLAEFLELYQ